MKLRLPNELEKFKFYFDKLQKYEGVIELKKIQKPRTLSQNKFLHVLINLFAIDTGYTIDEAKTLLKRKCDFMRYNKVCVNMPIDQVEGEIFLKRTQDLDVRELAKFITWIREYAGMQGIYLPSSDDYNRNWSEIEMTIENNSAYL